MCGIAGYVGDAPAALLPRMLGLLRHRGPDADGQHVEKGVGLGMTRLAIIDLATGQQPMAKGDGLVLFASEIKALLCHPAVSRSVDWDALHHYLAFGYTPADRSMFAGIAKLPPGHLLHVEPTGVMKSTAYWSLPDGSKVERMT